MDSRIPYGSQTVGPYFRIGLQYLVDRMAQMDAGAAQLVEIRGKVLDRDGVPVPDAMLEFWSAIDPGSARGEGREQGIPDGFRRAATDSDGAFSVRVSRPVTTPLGDGKVQSPFAMVLVFARGLMRHLITRVYLEDEDGRENDPILLSLPEERRGTLIARLEGEGVYQWDVRLQGENETVFFRW